MLLGCQLIDVDQGRDLRQPSDGVSGQQAVDVPVALLQHPSKDCHILQTRVAALAHDWRHCVRGIAQQDGLQFIASSSARI